MTFLMPNPGIVPFVPASVSFEASVVTGTNATDYSGTFDGIAIGTAAANRRVAVGVGGARGGSGHHTVSSMTIGGVSAAADLVRSSGNLCVGEIWSAIVPTGTTADIDIILNASMANLGIGVWAIYSAASSASDTLNNNSDPMTGAITIPTDGAMVAYAHNDGTSGSWAWTNATERFDEVTESAQSQTGADSTAEGVITITADPSTSVNNGDLLAVAWGPA